MRFRVGFTPYRGVLFDGVAFQLVDDRPARVVGFRHPFGGRVVLEIVVPLRLRRSR